MGTKQRECKELESIRKSFGSSSGILPRKKRHHFLRIDKREEREYMARAKHKNIGPHKSPKCEKYRNEQEGRIYNHGDSSVFPPHSF